MKQNKYVRAYAENPVNAEHAPSQTFTFASIRTIWSKSRPISQHRFVNHNCNGVRHGANQLIANVHPRSSRANQKRISWGVVTLEIMAEVKTPGGELLLDGEMWALLCCSTGRGGRTWTEGKQRRQGWIGEFLIANYFVYSFLCMLIVQNTHILAALFSGGE